MDNGQKKEIEKPELSDYQIADRNFSDEVNPIRKDMAENMSRINDLEQKLDTCTRVYSPGEKPSLADYTLSNIIAVWVIVFIVLLPIHCVIWLLKFIFDISWDTWGWITTAFYWLLPISAIIGLTGYLVYRYKTKQWETDETEYEEANSTRTEREIERRDKTFNDEINQLRRSISNKEAFIKSHPGNVLEEEFLTSRGNICGTEIKTLTEICSFLGQRIKHLKKRLREVETNKKPENEPDLSEGIGIILAIWFCSYIGLIAFHCIIWFLKLFMSISWDTWGWVTHAYYVLIPVSIFVFIGKYLEYKEKDKKWKEKNRRYNDLKNRKQTYNDLIKQKEKELDSFQSLLNDFDNYRLEILHKFINQKLALPLRSLNGWPYKNANKTYWTMIDRLESLRSINNPTEKLSATIEFFNDKLYLFYDYSMISESTDSSNIYQPFGMLRAQDNIDVLRSNFTPGGGDLEAVNTISYISEDYVDVDGAIDNFNEILEYEVSGVFTEYDSKKVEQQTNALTKCYNTFANRINSYYDVIKEANTTLGLIRMAAYRNLYLGAELFNVLRENAGGGSLRRANDKVSELSFSEIKLDGIADFSSSEAMKDIFASAGGAAISTIANILDDSFATKYYKKNPKAALATVATAAAVSAIDSAMKAWEKRNQKIAACLATQEELIPKMEGLVEQYFDAEAKLLRVIELSESLVKLNEGFMKVYGPLRDKIFVQKKPASITKIEIQMLCNALNDYKKAADSNL